VITRMGRGELVVSQTDHKDPMIQIADSPVFTGLGLPQQVLQSLGVVRSESTGSQSSLSSLLRSGDLLGGSDLGGGRVVLEL